MLLIGQGCIHRINCMLDPRQVIAAELIDGGVLETFYDGAALADQLFAKDG
jgi:hypothetical protein